MTTETRTFIAVQINGATQQVPGNLDIRRLLEHLAITAERVAVERNRKVIRKHDWSATVIAAGDVLEIVTFVGGG